MPFANEHSGRLQDPGKFESRSFRRNDSPVFGKKLPSGVEVIWGKMKGKSGADDPVVPQAIRFPKSKFTSEQAKKWLSDNNIKFILFEPAKKETKESKFEVKIQEQDDEQLKKSLREVKTWFTELKKDDESECNEVEIIDISKMVLREMVQRGTQQFHPENWKNEAIELYIKTFNEIILEGIEIPERVKKFLPILQESKHSHDKCMEKGCDKAPKYEVLWAEGIGHAWFCENDFKKWSTEGDGKGDICSCKEIKEGKASKKFGENKNPNIWDDEKNKFKEASNSPASIEDSIFYTLRKRWNNENSIIRYELLISNPGKESLDVWELFGEAGKELLESDKIDTTKRTMNIQTPNKEDFREWMKWQGSIPPKSSKIEEVYILKEKGDGYLVRDRVGEQVVSKPTKIKFPIGRKVFMDQHNNLYTGELGGPEFGNLTESSPVFVDIIDTGLVTLIEETNNFSSFNMSGSKMNGLWIMMNDNPQSNIWALSKGVDRTCMCEAQSVTDFKVIDVTDSTFPLEVKYRESSYKLIETKSGKLQLEK